MPSTDDFSVRLLVGGVELPEYSLNNRTYVECILSSPVSYKQVQAESVGGELEKQEWPVTPYRIEIVSKCRTDPKYFRVLVDGVKVKAISLAPNEKKVIKGFRDGPVIREFLFSMPRFAKDIDDRIDDDRVSEVGSIEVECWDAEMKSSNWKVREKPLKFVQANKKDSTKITNGEYTLATSKVGKAIAERSVLRRVDSWKRVNLRSAVKLHYRMGHTLQELGVSLLSLPEAPRIVVDDEVVKKVKKEDNVMEADGGSGDRRNSGGVRMKRTCVIDLTENGSSSDEEEQRRSRRRRAKRRKCIQRTDEESSQEDERVEELNPQQKHPQKLSQTQGQQESSQEDEESNPLQSEKQPQQKQSEETSAAPEVTQTVSSDSGSQNDTNNGMETGEDPNSSQENENESESSENAGKSSSIHSKEQIEEENSVNKDHVDLDKEKPFSDSEQD